MGRKAFKSILEMLEIVRDEGTGILYRPSTPKLGRKRFGGKPQEWVNRGHFVFGPRPPHWWASTMYFPANKKLTWSDASFVAHSLEMAINQEFPISTMLEAIVLHTGKRGENDKEEKDNQSEKS